MPSLPAQEDAAIALIENPKDVQRPKEQQRRTYLHPVQWAGRINLDPSFRKILLSGAIRALLTWLFIGLFYLVMSKHENRVLSPHVKSRFDVMTVALSLALGLNVASALRAIALDLRWWILSIEKRPQQEVDIILNCDSMFKLSQLVFVAPRPRTVTVTILWVALNLLAQAGIAVIGLTYSALPGVGDIFLESGIRNISVPDMTRFAPHPGRFTDDIPFLESYAAHVLSDIGSSYNFSLLPSRPLQGIPWASNPAGFWNATDHWQYTFLDSAPLRGSASVQYLSMYSNRTINSTASCRTPPFKITTEELLAQVDLIEENQTCFFPLIGLGLESIYYLTTLMKNDGIQTGSCGPGCANVKAIEPMTHASVNESNFKGANNTFFYDCNITVSADASDLAPVKGAIAAQAIALSGQVHPEFQSTKAPWNQYVGYNFGLPFGEPQNNSAIGMASMMSRFSIGVISAAAQTNPSKIVAGRLLVQGVRLQFDSRFGFDFILLLTGSVQTVLVICTTFVAGHMIMPGEVLLSRRATIQNRFVRLSDSRSIQKEKTMQPPFFENRLFAC